MKYVLIREGIGWGGLPRWMIAEDLARGLLVELDLELGCFDEFAPDGVNPEHLQQVAQRHCDMLDRNTVPR
jgi:DNA-binding transcriptional LysR family regulator